MKGKVQMLDYDTETLQKTLYYNWQQIKPSPLDYKNENIKTTSTLHDDKLGRAFLDYDTETIQTTLLYTMIGKAQPVGLWLWDTQTTLYSTWLISFHSKNLTVYGI